MAKRRFNLLRGETPAHPFVQKGLPVLASFVLFSSIPLASVWQRPSVPDPRIDPSRPAGSVSEIGMELAALSLPLREASSIGAAIEPAAAGPGEPKVREASEPPGPPPAGDGVRSASPDPPTTSVTRGNPGGSPGADEPKPELTVRRSGPVRSRARIFFQKAQTYQECGNFEMAVEMYRRVLQEKPGHRDALFRLSEIYMEQSRYAEAYPLVTELVRRRPDDPQGLTNLAVAEIALGKTEKAIAHLDEALTLADPPRFKIYFHQAVARSKLNRPDEAVAWYKKAEDLDPGDSHLLFNMAVTYDRLERYEEALRCYARFLKTDGPSSAADRGRVEARVGILLAYLVEKPQTPSAGGSHRPSEQER